MFCILIKVYILRRLFSIFFIDVELILLQVACNENPIPLSLIRFLLDVRADPSSANKEGNSPLHLIAYGVEDEMESPLADLLLRFGADPGQVNLKNETPLRIWKRWRTGILLPPTSMVKRTVPSLVSFSGRTIRRSGIPIHPGEVPETLRANGVEELTFSVVYFPLEQ